MHDVDHSAGVVYRPARFRPDQNAFEPLDPDDVRTHQVNAFAVARRTLEVIESAIGRQVHWAFGPQLAIHPHYLQDRNAYYSRERGRAGVLLLRYRLPRGQGIHRPVARHRRATSWATPRWTA